LSLLGGLCMDADHGDVDGDCDTDLALAQEHATNLTLMNDGDGFFSIAAGVVMGGSGDNGDTRLRNFDANDDGKDDIYFCYRSGTDQLYIQQ